MQNDSYLTIKNKAEGIYKEKGSKFIAFAYPVNSEKDIKEIIAVLKKEYHDARHHCYAYMLGIDGKDYRTNDDGEPSSTAGKPILGQILSHNLTNILVLVIRYFGGTKLGTSGLIHAYKTAAVNALANAQIITKTIHTTLKVFFNYPALNSVMRIIKEEQLEPKDRNFEQTDCSIILSVRKSRIDIVTERLKKIDSIRIEHMKMR